MEEKERDDIYRDIAKDVETRFDTSGYSKDDNRFSYWKEQESHTHDER